MQGPNVRKLIAHKVSLIAVPPGGGLKSAMGFLSDPDKIVSTIREATAWVEKAISIVRQADEPNPWRNADDETIAGEILAGVEKLNRERRATPPDTPAR